LNADNLGRVFRVGLSVALYVYVLVWPSDQQLLAVELSCPTWHIIFQRPSSQPVTWLLQNTDKLYTVSQQKQAKLFLL